MRKLFGLAFGGVTLPPGFAAPAGAGPADVAVELSPTATLEYAELTGPLRYRSPDTDAAGRPSLEIRELEGGRLFRLTYSDGTTFVLDRQGTRIAGSWTRNSTLEDTLVYLTGPVAGMLLYLRGIACLHASAVVVRGQALLFAGTSEAGKSTMAAAFAKRGFDVLGDDIAALGEKADGFEVQPGVPRILLWPPSVEAIWGAADALPLVVPNWEKRCLDLAASGRFRRDPAPLGAIYLLDERVAGGDIGISPLDGSKALMQLVANRYFTRFAEPGLQAREFAAFSRLQRRVPMRRVRRPDDRASLDAVCESILGDFDRIQATRSAFAEARV